MLSDLRLTLPLLNAQGVGPQDSGTHSMQKPILFSDDENLISALARPEE
jgi:hypothetical protein